MVNITIPSFEDLEDENGQLYTNYHVMIEDSFSGIRWMVLRRYSSFAHLYKKLKSKYPKIQSFRFPNKSVFNTYAHYTKERRRQGFEDLLKLIVKIIPISKEVDDFLELELHRNKAKSIRQTIAPSRSQNPSEEVKYPDSSRPTKQDICSPQHLLVKTPPCEGSHSLPHQIAPSASSPRPSSSSVSTTHQDLLDVTSETVLSSRRDRQEGDSTCHTLSSPPFLSFSRVRSQMPSLVALSSLTILLLYTTAVTFNIIDISSTSLVRILLTLTSLVITTILVRVLLMQREARIKMRRRD
mmetsp:Transcript_33068/g.33670  ORF Transcript_33068/g.33670 Transcript_33068/m.33670 type:complete len:297 (+) Transcript_33068:166-1056(+)